MKPSEALKELEKMGYKSNQPQSVVGTTEIRTFLGDYLVDAWHRQDEQFDPVAMVYDEYSGDYDWSYTGVYKNRNGTYALIYGSGCSCNSRSDSCTIDIYPDIDGVLQKLQPDKPDSDQWSWYFKDARLVILTKIATRTLP